MKIQLSEHFTYRGLLRFTFPSIVMMVFTSLYTIVDGVFVSNVVGSTAFAALNLVYPIVSVLGAFGFMVGTGGTALVSKLMGEGEEEKARGIFTFLVLFLAAGGMVLSVAGLLALKPFCVWMGADGLMLHDCMIYGGILLSVQLFFFLHVSFQSFFVAAARPKLGLFVTVLSGVTNMVLDWLFMAVFQWGLAGAAWATGTAWILSGLVPLFYFSKDRGSGLYFCRPRFDWRAAWHAMGNGASEMVTNLSISVVNMIYNLELMRLLGEDGVIAYGIIQYISFVFLSVYLGYAMGTAPVISYQYGAENHPELHSLFKKSLVLTGCVSALLTLLSEVSAPLQAGVFVGWSPELMALTVHAIRLYSLSFLICGFNIFASSFFTALNNGLISGLLSFVRTFLFQVGSIWIMGELTGATGIWLAVSVAELLALGMSVWAFVANRKRYGY